MTPERYRPKIEGMPDEEQRPIMEPHPDGDWVSLDAYLKLEKRVREDALNKLTQLGQEMGDYDNPEDPRTDTRHYRPGNDMTPGLTLEAFHRAIEECTDRKQVKAILDCIDRCQNIESFGYGQHWVDLSILINRKLELIDNSPRSSAG